jgi:hypothetical protein
MILNLGVLSLSAAVWFTTMRSLTRPVAAQRCIELIAVGPIIGVGVGNPITTCVHQCVSIMFSAAAAAADYMLQGTAQSASSHMRRQSTRYVPKSNKGPIIFLSGCDSCWQHTIAGLRSTHTVVQQTRCYSTLAPPQFVDLLLVLSSLPTPSSVCRQLLHA